MQAHKALLTPDHPSRQKEKTFGVPAEKLHSQTKQVKIESV